MDDVTFVQQAIIWLRELEARKRRPISPATLRVFGSYVRRLTPMIGDLKLADINNGTLRQLVQRLDAERLSAKTIGELVAVVKQVVGSVVDQDGNKVYRREWNHNFIDLPVVSEQRQPCVTAKEVQCCIEEAVNDQEKLFYCLLAGSGLRVSEALTIHVTGQENQTSWDPENQAIYVRSSIFNGREIPRLKTLAARRTVDLDPGLNDLTAHYVEINGIQPGEYLFQARSGRRPMHLKTARHRLAARGIPGFHAFRRFRITKLRELGVPEDILRFWVGHEGRGITDRYSKLGENVELRKQWAIQAGLGFDLPLLCKSAPPAPHAESPRISLRGHTLEPVITPTEVARYQASDDDLPAELFETPVEHSECA